MLSLLSSFSSWVSTDTPRYDNTQKPLQTMIPETVLLKLLLVVAAIGQLFVAALNLRLEKILGWKEDLAALPPLMREVFVVHKWFISITLIIFSLFTLRFSGELISGEEVAARWIAGSIAAFWTIRAVIQWCYYGKQHWKGKLRETTVHWILTIVYGGWSLLYGWCSIR